MTFSKKTLLTLETNYYIFNFYYLSGTVVIFPVSCWNCEMRVKHYSYCQNITIKRGGRVDLTFKSSRNSLNHFFSIPTSLLPCHNYQNQMYFLLVRSNTLLFLHNSLRQFLAAVLYVSMTFFTHSAILFITHPE